ncbi:hypothetical protein [Corynebacterium urealyticum]|nr:hypothetical protein [Corynebacterium urealyticum]WOH93896.1 hypothetical protein RZ943_07340 [Corynebacterium urealyticum]
MIRPLLRADDARRIVVSVETAVGLVKALVVDAGKNEVSASSSS